MKRTVALLLLMLMAFCAVGCAGIKPGEFTPSDADNNGEKTEAAATDAAPADAEVTQGHAAELTQEPESTEEPAEVSVFRDQYPEGAVLLYSERTNNTSDIVYEKDYCIYDGNGRLIQRAEYRRRTSDPVYRPYAYTNYTGVEGVNSKAVRYVFKSDGSLEEKVTTDTYYDEAGVTTSAVTTTESCVSLDNRYTKSFYTVDMFDRVIEEEISYTGMNNPHKIVYTYEEDSPTPLSSQFYPGSIIGTPKLTTYSYDGRGNLIEEHTQFHSDSAGWYEGKKTEYAYNEAGLKISEKHYDYEYGSWKLDKSEVYSWTYDDAGHILTYDYSKDELNTYHVRYHYGDPSESALYTTVMMPYDEEHTVNDAIEAPADYADVVNARTAQWGFGALGYRPADEFDKQFYGVSIVRLVDMDGDGSDELILAMNRGGANNQWIELWTMNKGAPVMVWQDHATSTRAGAKLEIAENDGKKYLVTGDYVFGGSEHLKWVSVENGSLVVGLEIMSEQLGQPTMYQVNGSDVDYSEYDDIRTEWLRGSKSYFLGGESNLWNDMEAALAETKSVCASLGVTLYEEPAQ